MMKPIIIVMLGIQLLKCTGRPPAFNNTAENKDTNNPKILERVRTHTQPAAVQLGNTSIPTQSLQRHGTVQGVPVAQN